MLYFSEANSKTKKLYKVGKFKRYLQKNRQVYSLDLPAGYTCPGAMLCHSRAITIGDTATIKDGPHCKHRCYAASQEVLYKHCRTKRQGNLETLRSARYSHKITKLVIDSLPKNAGIVRLHTAGDFFSIEYLSAMVQVARARPNILFYAYTKSLHFLQKIIDKIPEANLKTGELLPNFIITASIGGKYDKLIPILNIRSARVVLSPAEAREHELTIDTTDEIAASAGGSFALLIHGVQPAKTAAAKAWRHEIMRKAIENKEKSVVYA